MKRYSLSMNTVAQYSHVLSGAFLVEHMARWTHTDVLLWLVLVIVFAGWKEGWWDVHHETAETAGSGWEDFTYWVVGAVIGCFL